MLKSVMTILFSLALGLGADHLDGAYQFSQAYGATVSGLAFLTLYCIASTLYSSAVYGLRLGQASDRFLGPCATDKHGLLANLPMIIMLMAYSAESISSFLWLALSMAIGDIYYFKNSSHQTKEA